MIKEVLQQLEPLDAQIDALCSRADDAEMASTTTHAAELAELSAEENTLLQRCTSLTPEDRVFLARRPDRPHITEMIDNLFTDFFEQCGDRQCKEDAAILCGIARFHGMPVTGFGAPQRDYAGREPALQLWHAGTGGLPQGPARDETGRKISPPHHHFY